MDGTCKCGQPADVKSFPGAVLRCWNCWEKAVKSGQTSNNDELLPGSPDDFVSHDLSVANEGTEEHDHNRTN